MIFEAQVLNPATYETHDFNISQFITDVKTTKAINNIGSFSFSVHSSFSDFEDTITTPDGQGQIILYADGQPYLHGVIDNYSPTETGFVSVSCIEILQVLRDDIILGEFRLNNFLSEYVPDASPTNALDTEGYDKDTLEAYWGQIGDSYFAADIYTDGTKTFINALDDGEGVTFAYSGIDSVQKFFPRWMINNRQSAYTARMEGTGFPRRFHYLGPQNWNAKTPTYPSSPGEDGIYVDYSPVDASQTAPGLPFNVGPYYISIKLRNGNSVSTITQLRIDPFTAPSGRRVIPWSLLFNSPFKAAFKYTEDINNYYVSLEVSFMADGYWANYSTPRATIFKGNYTGGTNAQAFFMIDRSACKYNVVRFEKPVKETHYDWINKVSTSIKFIKGNKILEGYSNSLRYTDADKWQIVTKLLELSGTGTIAYAGIVNGFPTYKVYDYEKLTTLYKFADGSDIFSVRYEKDFSDTYNVLIANAKSEYKQGNTTVVNNIQVVIQPTPDRPNRLGRLKRRIQNPSGIEDIATLNQWALAVYEEHSHPSEPIDFQAKFDTFWLGVIPGQYITIHGLLEGRTVTEQINKISVDGNSGTVSIELAKRLTLKSVLLEARLSAE